MPQTRLRIIGDRSFRVTAVDYGMEQLVSISIFIDCVRKTVQSIFM